MYTVFLDGRAQWGYDKSVDSKPFKPNGPYPFCGERLSIRHHQIIVTPGHDAGSAWMEVKGMMGGGTTFVLEKEEQEVLWEMLQRNRGVGAE